MVTEFLINSDRHKPLLWISAFFVSLVLLIAVLIQVDWSQASLLLNRLSWIMVGGAFIFLIFEGIATALRLWLFAGKKPCLTQALRANAWYVLLLVVLPARLGEIAAIVVLQKYLGQKYGAAAMSIIIQRLYDVIILGVIFLIALIGLGDFIDKTIMVVIALTMMGFALFFLWRLDMFLTCATTLFKKGPKKLYHLVLQARLYSRHGLNMRDMPLALSFTFFKWISNLGALVFLFMALHLGFDLFQNLVVAASYNFLSIIPLQTIGGLGIGEAGLTLLLTGMGLPLSLAAGASLMIRFVIIIFPLIFFSLVMVGAILHERVRG